MFWSFHKMQPIPLNSLSGTWERARISIQSNDNQEFRDEEKMSKEESKKKGRRAMNCIDTYAALPTCLSGPEGHCSHAPSQLDQIHIILDDSNLCRRSKITYTRNTEEFKKIARLQVS